MLLNKTRVAYALFLVSFTIWFALSCIALFPTLTIDNRIQFPDPALRAAFIGSAVTASVACLLIGVHYLGWQEIESLQKKQAELDVSTADSAHALKVIIEGTEIQEDHIRRLEVQLNENHEVVSKLESRIVELENTLKKPLKEPASEEPEKRPARVTAIVVGELSKSPSSPQP